MNKAIKLIGREPEIDKLNRILAPGQALFLAVYGRRKAGKTFLIRQYLKDHIVFNITGIKDGTTKQQLQDFYEKYGKQINSKNKISLPGSWLKAFALDRADQTINLCEAKFTSENFSITKSYTAELRMKKSIFKQATQTKKLIFTTLLTAFPTIKNQYYQG